MLFLLIATFCISLTTGKHVLDNEYMVMEEESDGLVWPERYTVKAVKMSPISDLIEDVEAWKTNQSSRVDYNKGAVKSITILGDSDDDDYDDNDDDDDESKDQKYEIHPETPEDSQVSSLVCYNLSGFFGASLEEILPSETEEYKVIGEETIIDVQTTKFEYIEKSEHKTSKSVVWAANKDFGDESVWVPVKYEVSEYNDLLGSLTKHEVWYFSEFSIEFDDSVFDVEEYDCSDPDVDEETVIKELISVNPEKDEHVDHVFNYFKTKYERKYTDEKEHALRKSIFKQNMRLISSTNRKNLTYKLGVNQFADKTFQEIKMLHLGLLHQQSERKVGNIPFPYNEERLKNVVEELPEGHDLRLLGLVSSVKNQQSCGSCWTFCTAATAEGALARINGGRLKSLSNQAILDCAWGFGGKGCYGGMDTFAYDWMMQYGLPTVEDYGPYNNHEDYCHIANITTYPIKGYTDVTPFSESALKVAIVNHGPLTVLIEVTQMFSLYSRGLYYESGCGPTSANHGVTVVGYGVQDGELFWILKNSWGPEWGVAGYMHISARDNNCGVATKPSYVVF